MKIKANQKKKAQPAQLTPAQRSERIRNLPQRGKIKTPEELGLVPKAPGAMESTLFKRKVLDTRGQVEGLCPKCQQPILTGQMVNYPEGREAHVQCPPMAERSQPTQQPVASVRNGKKMAGVPPKGFSFVVPLRAAGVVAFHLAKAGLEGFEVINYNEDDASMFVFKNEPEHHVAEEIVRAEFAQQIAAEKGRWDLWKPQSEDPTVLKSEHDLEQSHQMMSSKKTAIAYDYTDPQLDRDAVEQNEIYRELEEEGRQDKELHEENEGFLRGRKFVGPQPVPSKFETALDQALSALDTLASVGPSEDIKGCASMSAGDLRSFADDYRAGNARHFSNEKVAGQWGERSYDSDKVHDILDEYRHADEGIDTGFDDPVPQELVGGLLSVLDRDPEGTEIDTYLGVVVFLVTHGSEVPRLYRDRAKSIAAALAGDADYLQEWSNPKLRHAELEKEIDILSRPTSKTALKLPEDLQYLNLPASSGPGMTDDEVKKMDKYRRKKLVAWLGEMGFLDAQGNGEMLAEYDAGDFWKKDEVYESARDMIREDRKFQNQYSRAMPGPRPYNRKTTSLQKRALDTNLATLVATWVTGMLVKWLGDEYSKRWGALAQQATAKAEAALQQKGVYDLGMLDKYAQENGTNRMSAFLKLAGQQLALAVVMTTGIAAARLFNGEAKAQAAPASVSQAAPVQNPDIYIGGPSAKAPVKHRPTKEQQRQHDQQVREQIRQQDVGRNPQNEI